MHVTLQQPADPADLQQACGLCSKPASPAACSKPADPCSKPTAAGFVGPLTNLQSALQTLQQQGQQGPYKPYSKPAKPVAASPPALNGFQSSITWIFLLSHGLVHDILSYQQDAIAGAARTWKRRALAGWRSHAAKLPSLAFTKQWLLGQNNCAIAYRRSKKLVFATTDFNESER